MLFLPLVLFPEGRTGKQRVSTYGSKQREHPSVSGLRATGLVFPKGDMATDWDSMALYPGARVPVALPAGHWAAAGAPAPRPMPRRRRQYVRAASAASLLLRRARKGADVESVIAQLAAQPTMLIEQLLERLSNM